MTAPDLAIAALAETQFGIVHLDQLRELGITRAHIRSRLGNGRLIRLVPSVYCVGGVRPSWKALLVAGLLNLGDTAVVSHAAAAALHGFDGWPEGPLEFTVASTAWNECSFARLHRTSTLPPIDRVLFDDVIRSTSASRTIIDLAGTACSDTLLGNAIDSAIRDGRSSPAFLRRRLDALRGPGRRGVRRLDVLLADSGGHSYLERAFLRLVREAGLPRPSTQVIHRRGGRTFARVDFEFAPLPLIVEVSGRRGHVTEADRIRDAQRRNELQSAGYAVLEFPTRKVLEHGEQVVAELRRELARLARRV